MAFGALRWSTAGPIAQNPVRLTPSAGSTPASGTNLRPEIAGDGCPSSIRGDKETPPCRPRRDPGSESASLASPHCPWRTLLVQPRLDPLFQELEELLYVEEGGRGIVVVVHQPVRVIGRVGSDVVDHES